VTYALIVVNVLVYFYQWLLSEQDLLRFFDDWAVVPAEVSDGQALFTLLTCTFLHGSWFHLGSNMLFLWIFGDNVEDVMGHAKYLIFYLLTGAVASGAQVLIDPDSRIPLVGASGAISGLLAAYIVLFPHGRIVTLIFLGVFFTSMMLPAWVMIGYWIVIQVISGVGSLGGMGEGGGVAFFAHIGGFVAGLATVWLFRDSKRQRDQNLAREGGFDQRQWPAAR
jgi:membrane associated rhomboid family serine protease